jgi:hypothetical protein
MTNTAKKPAAGNLFGSMKRGKSSCFLCDSKTYRYIISLLAALDQQDQ